MRLFELAGHQKNSDSVVFTFGRLNPPTIGHAKLLSKVAEVASSMDADHIVFLSQTQKPPKDPLPWNEKVSFAKKAFPSINISQDAAIRTPFQALEELGKEYKNIYMVVGGDRVDEFKTRMTPYAKDMGVGFDVISAGERDPDADGVEGMSASKARELAAQGDFAGFSSSLPSTMSLPLKKKIYNAVRKALTA